MIVLKASKMNFRVQGTSRMLLFTLFDRSFHKVSLTDAQDHPIGHKSLFRIDNRHLRAERRLVQIYLCVYVTGNVDFQFRLIQISTELSFQSN